MERVLLLGDVLEDFKIFRETGAGIYSFSQRQFPLWRSEFADVSQVETSFAANGPRPAPKSLGNSPHIVECFLLRLC